MNYQAQQNELRDRLAEFSRRMQGAIAQGLTDLPKLSENLVAALLKELLKFRNIRNLNAEERANFPGLDLADDELHVGIQVTATSSLDKVKSTIATVLKHGLQERYPRVVIFVLTEKQASYSQAALDVTCEGRLDFLASRDVLDYRDLLRTAATVSPVALQLALDAFRAYDSGVTDIVGAAEFDPPNITEEATLNVVELYLPRMLYVADVVGAKQTKRPRNERKALRETAKAADKLLPSGFEVSGGQLLTFFNLEEPNPFIGLYEVGTITPLSPDEFASVDDANQRVLKSLLRSTLQQQLYSHKVKWMHDEGIFCFVPTSEGTEIREVTWKDKRQSSRMVYQPMKSNKTFTWTTYRHFAFEVDFLRVEGAWYAALRPDWYYSVGGPEFRKSPGAEKLSAGLKRLENNQALQNHFRFLCHWLRSIETSDLLASDATAGRLSFGEAVEFSTHRCLDDSSWIPVKTADVGDVEQTGELFVD